MATGLGLAAKAAVDWDSAWAGVTKTVDGTDAELAAVEDGLRGLTSVLPASHAEIAAVAEAAGQLGIQTPNVVEFTRTMIDLGETTNLTSEQAATSLARFMNVMGTSQGEVSNLGSAIVDLGNNYATTEAEILEMAQRLSGAGSQIGMSEGQVLGLSTALSSVGIEAEAGGSAMSKVMIDIASSVDKGGERVEQFAKVAGMSAEDFSAKWRKDPGEALAAFVQGLANAEAQGSSTFAVLEELGITEVRMRDALLRSASAADQFSTAMAQGNTAFEENTALQEEAEKRYETTASQLSIMQNRVVDAAVSFGQSFLPAIEAGAEGVGQFADMLGSLDGPMSAVVAWGTTIAGGALLGWGAYLTAIPKIAEYRAALETLGLAGTRTVRTLSTLSRVAGVVGVFAAAQAAATGFGSAMAEKMSPSAEETTNAITTSKTAVEAFTGALEARMPGATNLTDTAARSVSQLGTALNAAAASSFWNPIDSDLDAVLGSWRVIGDEIAELSKTDMSAASDQFVKIAEGADLSRDQMAQLIQESDSFKNALIEQASTMGLGEDASTLLALALGEIGPAAGKSGEAANTAAQQYMEQADAAAAAADELRALVDVLMEHNAMGQSAEDANSRYMESLASVREHIEAAREGQEGYSLSMDANTAEGARNRAMLAGLAGDSQAAAQALFEQEMATGDSAAAMENYQKRLQDGRGELINTLEAFGITGEAAEEFADQVYKIPDEKEFELIAETAEAAAKINEVSGTEVPNKIVQIDADAMSAFEGIEGVNVARIDDKTAYVYGDNADAQDKIDSIIGQGIPGKWSVISADDADFWTKWYRIQQQQTITKYVDVVTRAFDAVTDKNADGGIYAYANGGIESYAGGGFPAGIYKGGAPIHKFAEPETIWEAYISGKPDQRDRNREIWLETGDRLGMFASADPASTSGSAPLIGSLTLQSHGNVRDDLGDVAHELRKLRRGGRYVGNR